MPQRQTEFIADRFLTNYVQGYWQRQPSVAQWAFTPVATPISAGSFKVLNRDAFLRDEAKVRPLGGEPELADYTTTEGTYICQEWAIAHRIDDRTRRNNTGPFNIDRNAADFVMQLVTTRQSRFWGSNFFKTGVWARDIVGHATTPGTNVAVQFNQAGSTPIAVIEEAADAMYLATGYRPNTLVLGVDVRRALRTNSDIVSRFGDQDVQIADEQRLQNMFEIERVITARQVYNASEEGQAASINYHLSPKSMWLGYRAPQVDTTGATPTAGVMFNWTGLLQGQMNEDGVVMGWMRIPRAYSDEVHARGAWDMKVMDPALGTFFSNIVS